MILADTIEKKVSTLKNITDGLWEKLIAFGIQLLAAIVILVVGRFVLKHIRKIIVKLLEKKAVDAAAVRFIDSLLKVIGYIVILMIIFEQVGVKTTSLVTLLGTAGLSVGLALQGSLANFAGGVMILINKPFKVGDYIKAMDAEGVVREMNIIYTTLTTVDNKHVKIPNGNLANSVITNYTFDEFRRIDVEVSVSYDDDIKKAVDVAKATMEASEYFIASKDNAVVTKSLEDSSVVLEIRMWVSTPDYWPARFDLIHRIKEDYEDHEITIPYNQLDVHLDK